MEAKKKGIKKKKLKGITRAQRRTKKVSSKRANNGKKCIYVWSVNDFNGIKERTWKQAERIERESKQQFRLISMATFMIILWHSILLPTKVPQILINSHRVMWFEAVPSSLRVDDKGGKILELVKFVCVKWILLRNTCAEMFEWIHSLIYLFQFSRTNDTTLQKDLGVSVRRKKRRM